MLFQSNGLRKELARSRRRNLGPTSTKVAGDGRSLESVPYTGTTVCRKSLTAKEKKGGATTCAIKFDDRCGVFKKKSVVDRVTRNFDCHILE